jgi:4-amino-4-deoxy-L-arabinose transferase-like glycosyltransferase
LESRFIRVLGLISLGVGVLLVLSCFSSTGILPDRLVEATWLFRVFVICVGILAAASGALSLVYPSRINRLFNFLASLDVKFQTRYFYLTFCFTCFMVALVFGLLVTQAGPGMSPDSAYYIRTGESLFHGQGFYQIEGEPYTDWPPLYPLAIAALMHIGIDSEQAARLIPILCFALSMFPVFFLGKIMCNTVAGYVACLIFLIFTPLLFITSYAWSEMPYIFFSLMAVLFLAKYVGSNRLGTAIVCFTGLFTALAILTRYIGVTLLPVGLNAIILKNKLRLKHMFYQLSLFGLISVLPIAVWLYRNITLTGNIVGYPGSSTIKLLADINDMVITIFKDFFLGLLPPNLHVDFTYAALAVIAAGFILLSVLTRIYSSVRKLEIKHSRNNFIVILYIAVYLVFLIIWRQIRTHDIMGTRQIGPIYPFLVLAAFSYIIYAYRKIERPAIKPLLFRIITILCFLFFVLQASGSLSFYQSAKLGQGYNSPSWRNEQGIKWILSNASDNSIIYSDVAEGVGFLIKKQVRFLPQSGSEIMLGNFINQLRNDEQSFLICFKGVYHRPYLLSNDELIEAKQKYGIPVLIADFPNSTVWRGHR